MHKTYKSDEERTDKEEIKRIVGSFKITKHSIEMDPPFLIEIDVPESKIYFNPAEITKIIEREKEKDKWREDNFSIDESMLTVYDREREKILKQLEKDAIPMLKGIGFSEDETQVMVLGAMEHESFTPDLRPEDVVGLALKLRGQNLLK